MTDDAKLGLWDKLEEARRERAEIAESVPVEPPKDIPLNTLPVPNTAPVTLPDGRRKVVRTTMPSGAVVETYVHLDAPPPVKGEWRPRMRRANPRDYERVGRAV
jgi:hypothetical protein